MKIAGFAFFGTAIASYCTNTQVSSFLSAFDSVHIATTSTEEAYVTAALGELVSSLSVSDWQSTYSCFPCLEAYLRSIFACSKLSSGCEGLPKLQAIITLRGCSLEPYIASTANFCSPAAYAGLSWAIDSGFTNVSAADYGSDHEYLGAMLSFMGTELAVSSMSDSFPCFPCLETLILGNYACDRSNECYRAHHELMMATFTVCAHGTLVVTTTPNLDPDTTAPDTADKGSITFSSNLVLGTFITGLIHSSLLN